MNDMIDDITQTVEHRIRDHHTARVRNLKAPPMCYRVHQCDFDAMVRRLLLRIEFGDRDPDFRRAEFVWLSWPHGGVRVFLAADLAAPKYAIRWNEYDGSIGSSDAMESAPAGKPEGEQPDVPAPSGPLCRCGSARRPAEGARRDQAPGGGCMECGEPDREPLLTALRDALRVAIRECDYHNREYKHRTPLETISAWQQLIDVVTLDIDGVTQEAEGESEPIAIYDLVQLKSGGPVMQVRDLVVGDAIVMCPDNSKTSRLDVRMLKRVLRTKE